MKSGLLTLFLLLNTAFGRSQQFLPYIYAQKSQIDSLQKVLKTTTNDTLRMELFRNLGLYYQEINRDSGLYYAEQQQQMARKLNQKIWEADADDFAGYVLNTLGNYPESLEYLLSGLQIAGDPASEKGVWKLSTFTGDENPVAARMFILGMLHQDIAFLFAETEDFKQAIDHARQTIMIGEQYNDKVLLFFGNFTSGIIYEALNKADSAIVFEQRALQNSSETGYTKYIGGSLLIIAKAYLKKGDKDSARRYLKEAIETSLQENTYQILADTYLAVSAKFQDEDQKDSTLFYARKALGIYEAIGSPAGKVDAYTALSSAYHLQGKPDSAYLFSNRALLTKDSLNDAGKIRQVEKIGFDEQRRLQELDDLKIQNRNRIRSYAMLAGLGVFLLIAIILYRNNRHKQKANIVLQEQKQKVETTLSELKSTQAQLIQREKMASLGELTAGIAHEIQNPMNFVNNFSEVNKELLEELNEEMGKGNFNEAKEIAKNALANEEKVIQHGKRADAILKSMLQHTRGSSGHKEPTDINALAGECLRLSYHGMRAKDKSFNAIIETEFDQSLEKINVVPQDLSRVILNLLNNAFYVVNEKAKQNIGGYEPKVTISTKEINANIEITVKDNGNGIPDSIKEKIFQPFFTTKPAGQGTGLGLSLSYDIVKAHGGEINVKTSQEWKTEFLIQLPVK